MAFAIVELRLAGFKWIHCLRMHITLRQLNIAELEAILELGGSLASADFVHEGSLPPAVVVQRAVAMILAGEPELWWAPFMIMDKADGAIVGGCAFKGAPRNGRAEMLYGLSKNGRGRGIAPLAIDELTAIAFERGATEVLAEIEPNNAASIRAVQKCGFQRLSLRIAENGIAMEQWVLAHR